jgi:hypothetical protein
VLCNANRVACPDPDAAYLALQFVDCKTRWWKNRADSAEAFLPRRREAAKKKKQKSNHR